MFSGYCVVAWHEVFEMWVELSDPIALAKAEMWAAKSRVMYGKTFLVLRKGMADKLNQIIYRGNR